MGGLVVRFFRVLSVKCGQLLGFVGIATLVGLLCAALAIPLVGALAYGTNAGAQKFATLPVDLKIPNLDGRTYVYDRNGGLIATFFQQNRVYVPINQIAPVMQTAIVDIEDERFYQHGAADLKGIVRALANNAQTGGSTQGGSTLTQQYVKNILKADAGNDPAKLAAVTSDTYARKLTELRYAVALEAKLSKKQILEGYLNISPFGQSVYGIEAAAEYYFGTTAARLTLPQAAMLAGEVQAPSEYDPTAGGTHVTKAIDRRNIVLAKMYSLKHITKARYLAAVRSPLGLHVTVPKQGCSAANVSQWYCDYIFNTLEYDPGLSFLGATAADRRSRIYSGGLKIYTALDPGVQKLADAGMATVTHPTDTPIASTAIVQPGTGDVLAISNSKTYGSDTKAGQSMNDFAVPYRYGNSLGFQPGSGMKPITMSVALEQGIPFSYQIAANSNLPWNNFDFTNCQGQRVLSSGTFHNEGGANYGNINMLKGLWESVNSYYVQLEAKVGLCDVAQLAAKMGVTTVAPSNGVYQPAALDQVPSLTLGSNVTSPLQMSEVYATIVNHGVYCPPRVVTRIVDVDSGRVLYDQAPQCTRVMPGDVADAVGWALYHNVQADLDPAATPRFVKINGIPIGGKTGTNDSSTAVWLNGVTPQFAASVAVAMPDQTTLEGHTIGGQYVQTATGGQTAGRVWSAIMDPILEAQSVHPGFIGKPADKFGAPGQYTGQKVQVPDVAGLSVTAATTVIEQAQLTATVSGIEVPSNQPQGTVDHTSPYGGSTVLAGSTVTIYVSSGVAPAPTSTPTPSATGAPTPNPTASAPPTSAPPASPSGRPTRRRGAATSPAANLAPVAEWRRP